MQEAGQRIEAIVSADAIEVGRIPLESLHGDSHHFPHNVMRNLHGVPLNMLVALKARNCGFQDRHHHVEKSAPGPLVGIDLFRRVSGIVVARDREHSLAVIAVEADGMLIRV